MAKVERELAAGYRRIKIKIKPGWDSTPVERVRARFGAIPLMVDANAAYTLDDADHLARLDAFDLMMIEQPLDYDDVVDHAALQRQLKTPICLDESIHTVRIAARRDRRRRLPHHQHQAGPRRRLSASRSGCTTCAPRTAFRCGTAACSRAASAAPHNIHLATLPNFTLPGDIAASKRYFDPDLIEPPIEVAADGTIAVPDRPGHRRHDPRRSRRPRDAEARRSLDVQTLMRLDVRRRDVDAELDDASADRVLAALPRRCASAPPAPAGRSRPARTLRAEDGVDPAARGSARAARSGAAVAPPPPPPAAAAAEAAAVAAPPPPPPDLDPRC